MLRNPGLERYDLREGTVPPRLQLSGHQPVCRIGGIVLPGCPIGMVAGSLEIAHQGFANLIPAAGSLRLGLRGGSDSSGFDHPQQCLLDGIVDTQAAEGNATRLAVVEQTPPAGIARDGVIGASVAERQLAATTPAAQQAGQQSLAVLGRSVMPT